VRGTISIGSDGAVTSWEIVVEVEASPASNDTSYVVVSCGFLPCMGAGYFLPNKFAGEYAQTTNNAFGDYVGISTTPGTWNDPPILASVPEPSGSMLLIGLVGLGLSRRVRLPKRRRKQ
jgi:PEP-CTERM motif